MQGPLQFAIKLIGASRGALPAVVRRWRFLGIAIPAIGLLIAAAAWEPATSAAGAAAPAPHGTLTQTRIELTALPIGLPPFARSDSDTAGAVACELPIDQSSLAAIGFFHQSDPLEAPHRFNAIGLHWDGYLPAGTRMQVHIRAGEDGILWSPWVVAEELDALRGSGVQDTDLVILTGSYVQYRLIVEDAPSGWEPRLDAVRVSYIDSSAGPTAEEAASGGSLIRRLAALLRPGVIGRGPWGANESLRYPQGSDVWPRSYFP
ncbi:MAG: hypothetical protein AAB289_02995, partial [Chloroflexota bacterium]